MPQDTDHSSDPQGEREARSRWRQIRDVTDHSTVGQVVGNAIWALLLSAVAALTAAALALWSFVGGLGEDNQSFAGHLTFDRSEYKDIDVEVPTNAPHWDGGDVTLHADQITLVGTSGVKIAPYRGGGTPTADKCGRAAQANGNDLQPVWHRQWFCIRSAKGSVAAFRVEQDHLAGTRRSRARLAPLRHAGAPSAHTIDVGLHLVRTMTGTSAANRLAKAMVVAPHRPGGQAQYIETPVPDADADDPVAKTIAWARTRLDAALPVSLLAERAHMSRRNYDRRFREITGAAPGRWLTHQRVIRAQQLLESSDLPVDEIARLCGFSSAAALRPHFRRLVGVTMTDYRNTFSHRLS
jgi:AraC-like DNA-binding protein